MRPISKKRKITRCSTCGKRTRVISNNGNCVNCADEKIKLANLEMKHKEGPTYEKWKRKMLKTLGVSE